MFLVKMERAAEVALFVFVYGRCASAAVGMAFYPADGKTTTEFMHKADEVCMSTRSMFRWSGAEEAQRQCFPR